MDEEPRLPGGRYAEWTNGTYRTFVARAEPPAISSAEEATHQGSSPSSDEAKETRRRATKRLEETVEALTEVGPLTPRLSPSAVALFAAVEDSANPPPLDASAESAVGEVTFGPDRPTAPAGLPPGDPRITSHAPSAIDLASAVRLSGRPAHADESADGRLFVAGLPARSRVSGPALLTGLVGLLLFATIVVLLPAKSPSAQTSNGASPLGATRQGSSTVGSASATPSQEPIAPSAVAALAAPVPVPSTPAPIPAKEESPSPTANLELDAGERSHTARAARRERSEERLAIPPPAESARVDPHGEHALKVEE